MKCADCKFFHPGTLTCHRHAPRSFPIGDPEFGTSAGDWFWPRVLHDDFCGEFSPREGDQEAARAAAAFAKEKGISVGDVMVTSKKDGGFIFAVFDSVTAWDLKPCSKCGATTKNTPDHVGAVSCEMSCSECGATTELFDSERATVEAWNEGKLQ